MNKIFPNNSFKLRNKKDPLDKDTSCEVIYNYFTDNNYLDGYDKEGDTNKELEYDLRVLKTYRDYIESVEKYNENLINCLILLITIIGIFVSLVESDEAKMYGFCLIIAYAVLVIGFYGHKKTRYSISYKIRVCNKIIYKLEDLK